MDMFIVSLIQLNDVEQADQETIMLQSVNLYAILNFSRSLLIDAAFGLHREFYFLSYVL